MAAKRKKPPGRNVHASERHTKVLQIRCSPELADKARVLVRERFLTLADLLEAGMRAVTSDDAV